MASAVIGALRVNLGIDTAQFSEGLNGARAALDRTGKQMQQWGGRLSSYITAPISAAAASVGIAVSSMAKDIDGLRKAAQISNVGFEEFQRLAFAAQSVGIETEKLSDIYKDVNDRIGDFMATGGGPMADFFENIAPKVGITADAFKNLSGPQALQLYYDSLVKAGASQADMTFYLEAMASDVTALIPLLKDGGAAFEDLGESARVISEDEAAQLKAYNDAMRLLGQSIKGLAIAIAGSGLVEWMTSMVEHLTTFIDYLATTNPEILKWGAVVAGLAAVIGPALVTIGLLATGIAAISAPAIAVGLAIAGITAAVVAFWPQIETLAGKLSAFLEGAWLAFQTAWDSTLSKIVAVKDAIVSLGTVAIEAMTAMVTGVTEWVGVKLNAVWDGVLGKVQAVKDGFYGLYDAVVGNSYIPDMVEGIGMWMGQLDSYMVQPATAAIDTVQGRFQSMASTIGGALRSVSGIMEKEGSKQLGISKAFGIAEAVINTAVGVTKALAQGGFLGIAKAAAVAAAGIAQITAIRSANRGGGGSVSRPAGGVSTATEDQQEQGSSQTLNLTLRGLDPRQLYTGETVRELAQSLVDYQRDGGQLIIAGS